MPPHGRHRQRRPHGLPPHVLRDAGQLQLRRLLQARGDPLGLGVSHQARSGWGSIRPGFRVTVYLDDDEAAEIWARRHQAAARTESSGWARTRTSGRPAPPARGPTASAARAAKSSIKPDDKSEVEIWNLVFTQFNRVGDAARQSPPAAEQEHRHRHGAGADRLGAAGRRDELSHRHPAAAGRGGRPKCAASSTTRPAKTAAACGGSPTTSGPARSPSTKTSIPAQQAELRHPAAAAPRGARRPPDGRQRAVPAQPGAARGRDDEAALSRTGRNRRPAWPA